MVDITKIVTAKYIFDGVKLHENSVVLLNNDTIIDIVHNVYDVVCGTKMVYDMKMLQSKVSQFKFHHDQVINYGNGVICPGFIDLQLNGCGGVLFNENISVHTLEIMFQTCCKYGTTSFLPTLITCGFSDVILALETVKEWFGKYGNSRGVIGIHLEGPFISKIKRGIHAEEFIIKPTNDLLRRIVGYIKYFPIKMTIAVEEFTVEQLHFLVSNGVILAIGHSNATYQQVMDSIQAGVKTVTHTFNAMSGLTARNPGVIGGALNSDALYTGVIADLLHVEIANIQLLYKLKQANKMYLVSDAVTPSGTATVTEFILVGKKLRVIDGKCIDETGVIGGANLMMPTAIKNCIQNCEISLEVVLTMASLTPATVMCLDKYFGIIKAGYKANLVYLDLEHYTTALV